MVKQTEAERCAEHRRFLRIHDAFVRGDVDELRAALDDPDDFPNTWAGQAIGNVLVYAVYWSPLPFVRALLDAGADPDGHDDDGFPPINAAISMLHSTPGANVRPDVREAVALLLERGSDPNQRGINDYTPLHNAAALGDVPLIRLLLTHGADPALRTRIDDQETAKEVAVRAGHHVAAELL